MGGGRKALDVCVSEHGEELTKTELMGAFVALELIDNELSKRIKSETDAIETSLVKAAKECSQSSISAAPAVRSSCIPTIKSRINGVFQGWDGHSVYELSNGQIWKQSTYHYHYHYGYSPEVMIYYDDGCHMKVEDDDDDGSEVLRIH
jgi:hypothetical protein